MDNLFICKPIQPPTTQIFEVNLKLHIITYDHFKRITHTALCRIVCRGLQWKQEEEEEAIAIVPAGEDELECGGGSEMVTSGEIWVYFRWPTDKTC